MVAMNTNNPKPLIPVNQQWGLSTDDFNLYFIQDPEHPMYVLANDYQQAIENWQFLVSEMDELDELPKPLGVQLVAESEEIIGGNLLQQCYGIDATIQTYLDQKKK